MAESYQDREFNKAWAAVLGQRGGVRQHVWDLIYKFCDLHIAYRGQGRVPEIAATHGAIDNALKHLEALNTKEK